MSARVITVIDAPEKSAAAELIAALTHALDTHLINIFICAALLLALVAHRQWSR